MKIKTLIIIFGLFLLITLGSGLVFFLTKEKNEPIVNERSKVVEKPIESASGQPVATTTSTKEKIIQSEKSEQAQIVSAPAEEKIKVVMLINGFKYEAAVKPGGSAYDLMNSLKMENKMNFSGKDYASLGFFVEEINGVKNNPAGANWLYYVNGQPAQVGISNYLIKNNDIIEWKYSPR